MKFNVSKEWVLHQARLEEGQEIGTAALPKDPAPLKSLNWSLFPLKEMFKRSWFTDFEGSLADAKAHAHALIEEYVTRAIPRPVVSLQRQRVRAGAEADPYALLAWQCRVLIVAKANAPRTQYKANALSDDWFVALVHLSRFTDGPLRAQAHLREVGIPLVIEPHLQSTHLDGAALLSERGPVVGLTLRHDRLDNFWFVLLHELIHVRNHLRKGSLEDIFDDLDVAATDIESEADTLAAQALIADEVWDTALPRFVRSEESILDFAAQLKISPAIVAGRIRREAEDYTLLNDLVGRGAVRKLFLR
ncbi:MAG TPA: ImmA/IrrE family metallo-endopeptidase [Opitutaceae bacterium]|nr:ImmA/IrrE family metallo-endopeptidase [Opitutaceae bacterium]